jgi:hypothetical protein
MDGSLKMLVRRDLGDILPSQSLNHARVIGNRKTLDIF